jgi:hypothetical protein
MLVSSLALATTPNHLTSSVAQAPSKTAKTYATDESHAKQANSDPFGLAVGDQVQVVASALNCRATPSTTGTIISTESSGQLGQITNGSVSSGGYIWWYIAYTDGHTGWSAEGSGSTAYLQNVTSGSVAYNRSGALYYAQHYWNKVTSDGYFWDSSSGYEALPQGTSVIGLSGDDCAHFASQVIGNQANQTGGGLNIPSRIPPTYGEPGAGALGDLLINDGWATTVSSVSQLMAGDLINYEWLSTDGGWDHVAVYLGNGTVAAHTTSHFGANWTLGGAYAYRFIHILNSSAVGGFSISSFAASPNPITVLHTTHLNVSAIGGTMPYKYTYTGLPTGCSSSNTSSLSCTPSVSGAFSVRIFVNDSAAHSANMATSLTVSATTVTLTSIALNPLSPTVTAGGTQMFAATPTCSATCPAGITYSWNLTSSALGTLTGSGGVSMIFTAGTSAGTAGIYVNATLAGATKGASTVITVISSPFISLALSPTDPTVATAAQQIFTATPTCSSTCPSGTSYVWSLTDGAMGTITGSGASVTFTAASTLGMVGIFVNATLNGVTLMVSTTITVTGGSVTLVSVSLTPLSPTVISGKTLNFTAYPTCTSACPADDIAYAWMLTNNALGSITGSGTLVEFFANSTSAGTLSIVVNATLSGVTKQASTGITIELSSTITSVALTPLQPILHPGNKQVFTAVPLCSDACPSGSIYYTWSITSSALGSLSGSGSSMTFTAGTTSEVGGIYVNATLNGTAVEASTEIIVSTSSSILTSVTISPTSPTVATGNLLNFTSSVVCIIPCQTGTLYSWSLTNDAMGSLGTINPNGTLNVTATVPNVTFMAAMSPGTVGLFLNVSYEGATVVASTIVTIRSTLSPVLTDITVTPTTVTLTTGESQLFSVSPTCTGVACPSTVSYVWSLVQTLGTLSQNTGTTATFTAGNTTGSEVLKVTASLNGVYVTAMAAITIVQQNTAPGFWSFSLSSWSTWVVIGAAVVVVAAVAVVLLARKGKNRALALQTSAQVPGGSPPAQTDLPDFPTDPPA